MWFFAFKIFSLPVPTRPGTRTFLQVPDPSRPEVENPYPSDPGCDKYQVYAQFKTFASEESAIGAETGIRRQIYFGKDQS